MTGIDILTRDVATMRNAAQFTTWGHQRHGTEWPISGDEIARMRAEAGESDGPDCGA